MFGDVVQGDEHESLEAKVAWFATLRPEERLRVLAATYELAVALPFRAWISRETEDVLIGGGAATR